MIHFNAVFVSKKDLFVYLCLSSSHWYILHHPQIGVQVFKVTQTSVLLTTLSTFDLIFNIYNLIVKIPRVHENIQINQVLIIFISNNMSGILQTSALSILGVTFQEDCRFTANVRNKLIKANKCLSILRSWRKEDYTAAEVDYLSLT